MKSIGEHIVPEPVFTARVCVVTGQKPSAGAELLIATHPEAAVEYAEKFIKGRWEMGEAAIATDAYASFHYAVYVVGGRWEMGEAAIAKELHLQEMYECFLEFGVIK